jgi:transposase
MKKETYDEATLDLLRLTIPTYGILVPIIQRSGTNEIIDGRHRLKIRDEMAAEGIQIMLPVHHVDTDNPEEIDQIVNSVRRPWQDTEQRRRLVAQLREKGHSHQRIADAVGSAKSTVQEDLKAEPPTGRNRPVGAKPPATSTGKDGKTRKLPATPEEIARAWSMKDSGMSTTAIAQDLGRGQSTVRDWFTKERPEAVAAAHPVAPPPAREKTVPRDDSLPLPQLSQDIIEREKKLASKRAAMFAELVVLQKEMTALWRYAQKRFEKDGRSVLRNHMGLADAAMQQVGALTGQCEALGLPPDASYHDMLLAVDRAGKNLSQSARTAIYMLGYAESMPN